jgi:ABC-type polysaccharide/polyol phosphate transport system ATPase subunit
MLPDSGFVGTQGRVAGLIEVGAGFHPQRRHTWHVRKPDPRTVRFHC